MIEDTINFEFLPNPIQKKPLKRRLLVGSMLALAALGAHHLCARTPVATEPETVALLPAVTSNSVMPVTGHNSLFGDAGINKLYDAPVASTLGFDELDRVDTFDQAALTRITAPTIDGLDSSIQVGDATASGSAPTEGIALSAVPEPTTAGLVLLAFVPAVSRRRSRCSDKQ